MPVSMLQSFVNLHFYDIDECIVASLVILNFGSGNGLLADGLRDYMNHCDLHLQLHHREKIHKNPAIFLTELYPTESVTVMIYPFQNLSQSHIFKEAWPLQLRHYSHVTV